MIRTLLTLAVVVCFLNNSISQSEEFKNIDGIMVALYGSISGPAGERDWDYFRSLFKPNAIMGAISQDSEGNAGYRSLTPEKYIESNSSFFLKNGFWEKELGREMQKFGDVAHIFSAYEFEMKNEDETINKRGINSIQLVFDSERWWIVSIQWDSERNGNTIPDSMLDE